MNETQLDRFEKKFDSFVEYVQAELTGLRSVTGGLHTDNVALREEVGALRMEMRDRFENVTDRLKRIYVA